MVNKLLSRIKPPISVEKAIKISDEYQFRVISTKEEADKFDECAPLLISVAKASIEAEKKEFLKFSARHTKFYLEKELEDGSHKFERKYSLNDFLIETLKKPLIDEDKVHQ